MPSDSKSWHYVRVPIRNEKVEGSIPFSGTNRINDLAQPQCWAFSFLALYRLFLDTTQPLVSPPSTHRSCADGNGLVGLRTAKAARRHLPTDCE